MALLALLSAAAIASDADPALIAAAEAQVKGYLASDLAPYRKLVLKWDAPIVLQLSDDKNKEYFVVAFPEKDGNAGGLAFFEEQPELSPPYKVLGAGWRVHVNGLLECLPQYVKMGHKPGIACNYN